MKDGGHQLIRIPKTGYHCIVCEWDWKSKPNAIRPGHKRYEWGKAPENLKTESQLEKMHQKADIHKIRGYVQLNGAKVFSYFLYDVNEAIPMNEEEIAAYKEKHKRKARK
jgi:hypothetical protein